MYYSINLMSDASERVPYNNPAFPLYASRGRISLFQNMKAASHWHDDIEFGIVTSGKMSYCVNGEHFSVNAGEGVFINSQQLHHNYSADGSDCQYLCVLIHPSLLCENQFVSENFTNPLLRHHSFAYATLGKNVAWQAALMEGVEGLLKAYIDEEEASYFTVLGIAYQIAAALFAHMPKERKRQAHVDRRISALRNMVGFIQSHYDEPISLLRIASAGNVSESGCCALFKRQLNQSPIDYVNRYRLEKGLGLLAQPELTVTEIAYAVGFASASYFAETFRKHFGLSPSAYRKLIR